MAGSPASSASRASCRSSSASRPGRGAAPPQAANSGPVLTAARAARSAVGERVDPPGGQRAGGQRQPARIIQVRVGIQQPQAPQPGRSDPPTCPASTPITGSGTGTSNSVTARSSAAVRPARLVQQGVQGQVLQERPHHRIGGQVTLLAGRLPCPATAASARSSADLLAVDQPQADQVLQARVAPA